ncbi:MAG: NADH-quinone oxidoreductase subunit A [Francisellaceae bacterium]|jgi:NADH-quinone oxidoreductase subunit A
MLYESYLPLLIFLIIAIGLGLTVATAGKIVAKLVGVDRPNAEKNSPFECGFPEFDDARMKFDVRFYLVAILFIVFDLEMAFMFPWAVVFTKIGWAGFISMIIFLVELFLGFIYLWKKGALEWE